MHYDSQQYAYVTDHVLWMLSDQQGTVRDVAEYFGGGTVVQNHLQYDSFGNVTSQTNAAFTPTFTYAGRQFDADSGLYYYRARWYDSAVGRFVSEDPSGFAAGDANLYRYCGNAPTHFIDPSGKAPELPAGPDNDDLHLCAFRETSKDKKPPVEKNPHENGTVEIVINSDNTIVVLFGEGNDKKTHSFVFNGENTFGIFVGCYGDINNMKIPKNHLLPHMRGMTGVLYSGIAATRRDDNERFDKWMEKAKKAARTKAEQLLNKEPKKGEKAPESITIRGVFTGGWWAQRSEAEKPWTEVIKAKPKPKPQPKTKGGYVGSISGWGGAMLYA